MSLKEIIEERYKNAIKAKNTIEINTFRLIKSAIKDREIAARTNDKNKSINDAEIFLLLQTLVKQRKDSIDSFKIASRNDLIIIEQGEIDIINQFLPEQLSDSKIEEMIVKIIKNQDLKSIKDMGKLMNEIKKSHGGSVDMALVGKIAKSKLLN